MKLNIRFGYSSMSKTKGRHYPSGVYDLDNEPELNAIADYLVANGHASYEDTEPVPFAHVETVAPAIEFTSFAISLLEDNGWNTADVSGHFSVMGIDKVSKSDVQTFLDELSQ